MRFSDVPRYRGFRALFLGAFASAAIVGCDAEKEAAPAPVAQPVSAIDAAAKPESPLAGKSPQDLRYEPTISGLTLFMRDLRVAIMSNDEPAVGLMVASLRLKSPELWMTKTFGEDLGNALTEQYMPQSEEIGLLVEVLKEQYDAGLVEVDVGRFQTKDNPSATGYQSAALGKMLSAVPLYSVRLVTADRKKSFHIWSFVHENESFRFIGKLRSVATKRALGGRDLNEYRISVAEKMSKQPK